MFRICKNNIMVCAAHKLTALPPEHKCHRLHGHNYEIEVTLSSRAIDDKHLWLVDFGDVKKVIEGRYDHRYLNDFPELMDNPTAELFAKAIADLLDQVLLAPLNQGASDPIIIERVRVSEVPGAWAEWVPGDVA